MSIAQLHSPAVRVRFAPSPTGNLHLGGLRTALFNYLLARKTGGQFLIRIEDTDQSRYVEGAVDSLLSALSWAGIKHDEGPRVDGPHAPYFQSQRTDLYRHFAETLVKSGNAYRCFCTQERLQRVRMEQKKAGTAVAYDKHCLHLTENDIKANLQAGVPFTVRMNIPIEGTTQFVDKVHGKLQFSHKVLDDTILLKSDGFPTYHLANVVDDHAMEITHVLRGEEWIASTPKHILLYQALGWKPPTFAHLPLLLNADRTKLSKRSGDVHVEQYIEKGYLPESITNFVALLGWHDSSGKELFTMEELVENFDLDHVGTSGAVVDHAKLDWINKHHLLVRASTQQGLRDLATILDPLVRADYANRASSQRLEKEYLVRVIDTIKERIRTLKDIPDLCNYFFVEPDYASTDSKGLKKKLKSQAITLVWSDECKAQLCQLDPFDTATIKAWLHDLSKAHQLNTNHIMMAFRYAITGTRVGAGIAETMETLGKATCLDRLTASQPTIANNV